MGPTLDLGLTFGQRQGGTPATVAEPTSDARLVAAARNGDRTAFGQLYDRYGSMVHGILLARVRRCDVADLVTTCSCRRCAGWVRCGKTARSGVGWRRSPATAPWTISAARRTRRRSRTSWPVRILRGATHVSVLRGRPLASRGLSRDPDPAPGRGDVRSGDRRQNGAHARFGTREPSPRDEAAPREAGLEPRPCVTTTSGTRRASRTGTSRSWSGRSASSGKRCRHPTSRPCPSKRAPLPSRRTKRWLAAWPPRSASSGSWRAGSPAVRCGPRCAWPVWQEPRIGGTSIAEAGRLRAGQDLVTDAASRARIDMGLIGEVEVEPLSRVGLVTASPTEHRLTLRVGTLHARIWAPPRLFFVDTPSATAVDLGCTYTLAVDAAGTGRLNVTQGWVAFEYEGRESFVPEGAMCITRLGTGPGTPYRSDAPAALREALERLDLGQDPSALDRVLTTAGEKDTLSLWHLLARTSPTQRGLVFDRLAELLPPPDGVTRDGILTGDREMLDRWWEELGLGSASWWRSWKGPSPRGPLTTGGRARLHNRLEDQCAIARSHPFSPCSWQPSPSPARSSPAAPRRSASRRPAGRRERRLRPCSHRPRVQLPSPTDAPCAPRPEGVVDGKRKTIPFQMKSTGATGVYSVTRQWPAEGSWVLVFSIDRGGQTTALVKLDTQGKPHFTAGRELAAGSLARCPGPPRSATSRPFSSRRWAPSTGGGPHLPGA